MKRSQKLVLPVLLVSAVGLSGSAIADAPAPAGTVSACYAKHNGLLLGVPYSKGDLRYVEAGEACRAYETAASWSQQGPKGEPGAPGTPGMPGETGPTGPVGATGPAGGLAGYEIVTKPTEFPGANAVFESGLALCPGGKAVIGGGYDLISTTENPGGGGSGAHLEPADEVMERPYDSGVGTSGWLVDFKEGPEADRVRLVIKVYAICASVE